MHPTVRYEKIKLISLFLIRIFSSIRQLLFGLLSSSVENIFGNKALKNSSQNLDATGGRYGRKSFSLMWIQGKNKTEQIHMFKKISYTVVPAVEYLFFQFVMTRFTFQLIQIQS